jgi:cytosine/adenosine deaminase-related metal-dependent hydrolase
MELAGSILTEDGLRPATVAWSRGRILGVDEIAGSLRSKDADRVILPGFVNAHVHTGDAFIRRVPQGLALAELVAPPDGYKHRRLREAPRQTKVAGMVRFLREAWRTGTSRVIDFREEGLAGVSMIREAERRSSGLRAPVAVTALGRPHDREAPELVVRAADGLGISSLSDSGIDEARAAARAARAAGKPFAIHFSEAMIEHVGSLLELRPSLVVHLCHAGRGDLERIVSAGVPVAVCPRSNLRFGRRPPARELLDLGARVCLGTDNAMLAPPDILAEARALPRLSMNRIRPLEALRIAVLSGQGLLGSGPEGLMRGAKADFLALRVKRPSISRVLAASPAQVARAALGAS